jgi:hypothetical protein
MKTAVLISGHMRSFAQCLPQLNARVFDRFPDADFFVSTVQDADAASIELLQSAFPGRGQAEVVREQPDCIADLRAKGCQLPTVWEKGKPYMRERYWISVHPQAIARQLWQLEQCWRLFTTAARPSEYGTVIRCRPDLWVHSADFSDLPPVIGELDAWTPWWGRFAGTNDRFAVLGMKAAEAYFTTYSQIPTHLAQGGNLHPETLVHASLMAAGCAIHDTLGIVYSTLRTDGVVRPPEIISEDITHLAASR